MLLTEVLEEAAGLRPKTERLSRFITDKTVKLPSETVMLSFSGGVADLIRESSQQPYLYGDLGVLLGRGKSYAQAKELLAGVTLESVAIAQAMSNSLRKLAAAGTVDLKDFPLLLALDATIHHGADLDIPWEKFILDRP